MKLLAVFLVAVAAVSAVPVPDITKSTFDDVNGSISATNQVTDSAGNTNIETYQSGAPELPTRPDPVRLPPGLPVDNVVQTGESTVNNAPNSVTNGANNVANNVNNETDNVVSETDNVTTETDNVTDDSNNPANNISTVKTTSSFVRKNSVSNSVTDADGNTKTTSDSNHFSGTLDSTQTDVDGKTTGSKTITAEQGKTSSEGLNGVEDVKSTSLRAADLSSFDQNGQVNHEAHYESTSNV